MTNAKPFLWALVGYVGMLLLILTLAFLNKNYNQMMAITSSIFFMFIFGGIFTSFSFNNIHKSQHSFSFLTLPASSFEKFFVSWLLSSVIYIILFVLLSMLAIAMTNGIAYFTIGSKFDFPDMSYFISAAKYYMLINLIYLYGSAHFKKAQFILTSVFLGAFTVFLILASFFLFKYSITDIDVRETINFDVSVFIFNSILFKIVLGVILPCSLLVATYFRLKEKEV
ncbi:MAG: hypothetical protein WCK02_03305 [Bacteroidota bacterium]